MQMIGAHVIERPCQPVQFPRRVALGPEIGAPEHERHLYLTVRRVEVHRRIALDLALHNPARAEAGFISIGLRAAAFTPGPSAEGAAGEIDHPQVWIMM